ncbi:MAG: hypothetical protein QGM50_11925 [Anaerolineae bacterium]|nr:hypothetical protein [Anaerolineae bacterium]
MCTLFKSHIRSAALHEAGHVAAAYFAEYSCDEVYIDEGGNGVTKMNYGTDTILATAIMNRDSWQQLFKALPYQIKINAKPIAMRLCCIIVAGGVAESIRKQGRNFKGTAEVELSGPDLNHALSISRHFQINVNELITNIYEIFKLDAFWKMIIGLSKNLVRQRHLSKKDIESIISNEGLLEYLKTINAQQTNSADRKKRAR